MPVRAVAIEACTELLDPGRLALRCALWPDADEAGHRVEMAQLLAAGPQRRMQLVARGGDGAALGLAEAALRRDHVNGTDTSPVAFLEGLYVVPAARHPGHRALGFVETERVVYFRLPL